MPVETTLAAPTQRIAARINAAAAPLAALLKEFLKRMRNRAAIRQLSEADDYMLRDIGLTRSDVETALRSPPLADPLAHVHAFCADQRHCRVFPASPNA